MAKIFENEIDKLRNMNPEYKYNILYEKDAEYFILKYYNEKIWRIYNSINECYGSAKGDLLRYLILYEHGGVYFDLKSGTKIPLREIIHVNDECLLSSWEDCVQDNVLKTGFGEYPNWLIISKPGHIFLKNVIKDVCDNILNYKPNLRGKYGVLRITGPIAYTQSIIKTIKGNDNINYRFKVNNLDGNVVYNNITSIWDFFDWNNSHISLLNKDGYKHYTDCTELIIDKNKLK